MKSIRTALTIIPSFVAMLLVGCAAPMHKYTYEPTKESAEKLQTDEARETLKRLLSDCWYSGNELAIHNIMIFDDRMEITAGDNKEVLAYRFDDIGKIRLTTYDSFDAPNFYSLGYLSNNTNSYRGFPTCSRGQWSIESSQKVADALLRLKLDSDDRANREADEFLKVVTDYRQASRKPELPEEARKYKVQAELAIKERRFGDSVERYSQAIRIAPWWPEAHFNRALVLGELKRYGEAVVEMNRYLQLTPEAPDARAARDKVYEWEDARKAKSSIHE
jgi:tetratricopeptide (TPR) repeat protein